VSEKGIGIIVLAAGASSRMGEPKQRLFFEGETLLGRAVRAALETGCRPVVVVLGAEASVLLEEIAATGALPVVNQSWAEGLSSSLRCGLRVLEDSAEAAVVMLCDQPFVTGDVIRRLVDAYLKERSLLVASVYEASGERTCGVPALFSRALFPELSALRGASGARHVIARHKAEATLIEVPEAAFDVDTPGDFERLTER
jgi:molybdenum cofactor cytidylyltransferase